MLYFDFTIENIDKTFIITEGNTLDTQDYPSFSIYNYGYTLTKPDLLIYYKNNSGRDIYKKVTENIHTLAVYDKNTLKFEFKLFTTSSILTISLSKEILQNVNLYVDNKRLEDTTTILIVPKYIALNCWFEIKNINIPLSNLEITFSYPILLKKFTTFWSII